MLIAVKKYCIAEMDINWTKLFFVAIFLKCLVVSFNQRYGNEILKRELEVFKILALKYGEIDLKN